MSQSRQLDEDTDMAISYTQPSAGHQTLPSFREVSLNREKPHQKDRCKVLIPLSFSPLTSTMKSNQPHHTIPHHAHKTARVRATKWPIPAPSHTAPHLKCHTKHTVNIQSRAANAWTRATRCGSPKAHPAALARSSHPSETWTQCQVAQ